MMSETKMPERAQVQEKLQAAGIPTAVHYPVPLNKQQAYAGRCHRPTPVAEQMQTSKSVI